MLSSKEKEFRLTRRSFATMVVGGGLASLLGCTDRQSAEGFAMQTAPSRQLNYPIESYKLMYAGIRDQQYNVPPVPYEWLAPDYRRQIVHDPTVEPTGTIVIDERSRYLYLIIGNRKAVRYGIAIGPSYSRWSGRCHIRHREKWPVWDPPNRSPQRGGLFAQKRGGQSPGLRNPYGSRAMFIYQNQTDTELVIHGTSRWDIIGGPAPHGSILMLNQDVIDLYQRTQIGAPVVIV